MLQLFVTYPQLSETLEGLTRWRLREEFIRHTTAEVSEALGWLHRKGFLTRCEGAARVSMFALNESRKVDAQRLLTEDG